MADIDARAEPERVRIIGLGGQFAFVEPAMVGAVLVGTDTVSGQRALQVDQVTEAGTFAGHRWGLLHGLEQTVTPGRESDFVRVWEELRDWTLRAFPGAHGTLLRESERPNVFISFGPWPDKETAARWQMSDEFRNAPRHHPGDARAVRAAAA